MSESRNSPPEQAEKNTSAKNAPKLKAANLLPETLHTTRNFQIVRIIVKITVTRTAHKWLSRLLILSFMSAKTLSTLSRRASTLAKRSRISATNGSSSPLPIENLKRAVPRLSKVWMLSVQHQAQPLQIRLPQRQAPDTG